MIKRRSVTNWDHLKPFLPPRSRLKMGLLGVISFLGGLAESGVLVIVAIVADTMIRGQDTIQIAGIELSQLQAVEVALIAVLARIVLNIGGSLIAARFSAAVMVLAQRTALKSYLDSSYAVRSSRNVGDLSTVSVNHGRMVGALANDYTSLAAAICGLAAFGGMSLVVNPLATIGITILGGLLLVVMGPIRSRYKDVAIRFAEVNRSLGADITQVESLQREIEIFDVSTEVRHRVHDVLRQEGRAMISVRFLSALIPQIFQSLMLGAAVLSLLVIVNIGGDADLAAIGAVVLLLIRSMSAAQQMVSMSQRVVEHGSYALGLNELIQKLHVGTRLVGDIRPDSLSPLELKSVDFTYDGETIVLKQIDAQFTAGELVGLVGPSGAGKSTMVELLLRLRTPTGGSISCGSVEIQDVHPEEFGRRVAFVPQRPVMISGTVAENVDFYRGLPHESIQRAIKAAYLSDEVEALPDGIQTRLGPDGWTLSGGQQQRLTIARALAGDPEILILDEPTSALDAVSEAAIKRTLVELPTGRIVIIVAHRYSTLASCNRILVLEDGRIQSDATPDQVAQDSEFFKVMVGGEV